MVPAAADAANAAHGAGFDSADGAAAPEQPISKSEFARRRNVTPGRVSQWIAEKKISGAALTGEGRFERIVESIACAQLNIRLDLSQRLGNGIATRLDAVTPASATPSGKLPEGPVPAALPAGAPAPPSRPLSAADAVATQIQLERLEQIQRVNRREAIAEAVEAGALTDATAVAQAAGRQAAQMIAVFEGALPELAAALAAKFTLPQRDVAHLLRGEFRKVRAAAAELARHQAAGLPDTAAVEIETADDDPAAQCRTADHGSDGEGLAAAAAG
jgi:hypothetical protein